MGQSALPEARRKPGGGTKLLSLSQQQLMQELWQQIGILKQAAVLSQIVTRPVPGLPLSNTSLYCGCREVFLPGTDKLIFQASASACLTKLAEQRGIKKRGVTQIFFGNFQLIC